MTRATALRPANERPDRARRPAQAEVAAAAAEPVDPVEAGVTFATVAGEPLVLARDVAVTVGFHESGDPRALPLEPVGTPTENLNAARFIPPAPSGDNDYLVLPTRRRAGAPTSAVDLRMDSGVPVVAPVTGIVQTVATYTLYGRTPDVLVEIVPEGRPDLLVRMLHIEAVQVSEGVEVEAGATVIAGTSRQLPFRS
jgi:hypothetical protein